MKIIFYLLLISISTYVEGQDTVIVNDDTQYLFIKYDDYIEVFYNGDKKLFEIKSKDQTVLNNIPQACYNNLSTCLHSALI